MAAFEYAKVFSDGGVWEDEEEKDKDEEQKEKEDAEEKVESKVERSLEYSEFRIFLRTLTHYYIYCQVTPNPRHSLSSSSRMMM